MVGLPAALMMCIICVCVWGGGDLYISDLVSITHGPHYFTTELSLATGVMYSVCAFCLRSDSFKERDLCQKKRTV